MLHSVTHEEQCRKNEKCCESGRMAVRGPWRSLIPRTTATTIRVNIRNTQLTTDQYHFVRTRFSAQSTCSGQLPIGAYLWQEDSVWLPRNGALPGHPQNPFGSPKPGANASCKGSAQRGCFHVSRSLHFDLQGLDNNETGLLGAAGCMLIAVSIPWRLRSGHWKLQDNLHATAGGHQQVGCLI